MSERLVRIEMVRFEGGSGPSSGYQLVDAATGEPVGAGLFATLERTREHAERKGWSLAAREPVRV